MTKTNIRNTTTFKEVLGYINRNKLDVNEETAINYYFEILLAMDAEKACGKCKKREDCPLDPPGHGINIRVGGDIITFSYYPCAKERQQRSQRKIQRLIESSQMPELFREKTFDNFRATPGVKDAYEAAQRFCRDGGKGLVFAGNCGIGKSHLAAAIINDQAAKGREFAFCTTPELIDDIKAAIENKQQSTELMELIKNIDLLFLDDLGAEKSTEWVAERFFVIINARLVRKKVTIITTNYIKPSDLIEKIGGGVVGQRIVSRIREMCDWVVMEGKDWRLIP